MTKALIAAILLSQAPIQDIRMFHERVEIVEYINYERRLDTRRVNTIHVRRFTNRPVVVPQDPWYTKKDTIPYVGPWANSLGQTAQQFIAIVSMLQDEGLYWDWEQSTR